jgi:hypothetical protein
MTVFSDAQLSAYLDGEADAETTAAIEDALQQEPGLAGRLEAMEHNDLRLRNAIDQALGPAPARLTAMLSEPAGASNVIPLGTRTGRPVAALRRALPWAAALVVGVFGGAALEAHRSSALLIDSPAGPLAGPALTVALANARSGLPARADGGIVRIALSFQSRAGSLCRQFTADYRNGQAAGVACREPQGWRVEGWTSGEGQASEGYRTAGGPENPVISAELDRLGVASVLDEKAEAAAAANGWRAGSSPARP